MNWGHFILTFSAGFAASGMFWSGPTIAGLVWLTIFALIGLTLTCWIDWAAARDHSQGGEGQDGSSNDGAR